MDSWLSAWERKPLQFLLSQPDYHGHFFDPLSVHINGDRLYHAFFRISNHFKSDFQGLFQDTGRFFRTLKSNFYVKDFISG